MSFKFSRSQLFWVVPVAVLAIAGVGYSAMMMGSPPSDLDLALSKPTDHGLYIASLAADQSPIPVGAIHTWTVRVTTPEGTPADALAIAFDGGMPQHGHGLPTKPQVTTDLGDGRHLIEGVKFNMDGWWTITISIEGAQGADAATFNLVL